MWFSYKNMNIRWETRDLMRLWKEKKGEILIDDEKGNWKEKDICSNHPACPAVFFVILRTLLLGTLLDLAWIQDSTQVYPQDSSCRREVWTATLSTVLLLAENLTRICYEQTAAQGAWWGFARKTEPKNKRSHCMISKSFIIHFIRLINRYILVTCRETQSNLGLHHVSCVESLEDISMLIWPFF